MTGGFPPRAFLLGAGGRRRLGHQFRRHPSGPRCAAAAAVRGAALHARGLPAGVLRQAPGRAMAGSGAVRPVHRRRPVRPAVHRHRRLYPARRRQPHHAGPGGLHHRAGHARHRRTARPGAISGAGAGARRRRRHPRPHRRRHHHAGRRCSCIAAAFSWSLGNMVQRRVGRVDMLAFVVWSQPVLDPAAVRARLRCSKAAPPSPPPSPLPPPASGPPSPGSPSATPCSAMAPGAGCSPATRPPPSRRWRCSSPSSAWAARRCSSANRCRRGNSLAAALIIGGLAINMFGPGLVARRAQLARLGPRPQTPFPVNPWRQRFGFRRQQLGSGA